MHFIRIYLSGTQDISVLSVVLSHHALVSEQLFVGIRVNRGPAWQWQYD